MLSRSLRSKITRYKRYILVVTKYQSFKTVVVPFVYNGMLDIFESRVGTKRWSGLSCCNKFKILKNMRRVMWTLILQQTTICLIRKNKTSLTWQMMSLCFTTNVKDVSLQFFKNSKKNY